jgi:hypothetical protein
VSRAQHDSGRPKEIRRDCGGKAEDLRLGHPEEGQSDNATLRVIPIGARFDHIASFQERLRVNQKNGYSATEKLARSRFYLLNFFSGDPKML